MISVHLSGVTERKAALAQGGGISVALELGILRSQIQSYFALSWVPKVMLLFYTVPKRGGPDVSRLKLAMSVQDRLVPAQKMQTGGKVQAH